VDNVSNTNRSVAFAQQGTSSLPGEVTMVGAGMPIIRELNPLREVLSVHHHRGGA